MYQLFPKIPFISSSLKPIFFKLISKLLNPLASKNQSGCFGNPGLFFEQAFLRNIDLSNSLMIGDSTVDKLAAENAGCKYKHVNDL